ncbi:MAG: LysM peptidoglycan-binding domain-containing M23 family metallopeptidase [Alphaproteobacteria bacterium]|nr:MAG: LysM peptidoglycan-binding domain-containing M23 family metallopeptidase [Alphaproteobacteria bacterium]
MSFLVEPARSRAVSRLALMAALAAGLAGCSSDRFMDTPFASRPQASPEVTGSVRPQAAPSHKVESSALPPPTYGGSAGIGGIGGTGSTPPPARQEVTGSVSAHQKQPAQPGPAWSWDGGTAIIVAQGETLDTIARRHGVPASAIMQANNMTHAAQLQPGQRLVIPRVQQPLAAAPPVSAPATRLAGPMPAPAGAGAHIVKPGETIYSLARHYRLTPMAIAKANNVGLDHRVKVGDRVVIPGQGSSAPRLAAPAPAVQPKPAQPAPQIAAKPDTKPAVKPQAAPKVAQNDAAPSAHIVAPAADPLPESAPTGTTGNASVSLRWPVRGKVIQAFGPKSTGGQNDGINVSVPEGTPIKAAEDGVVAYAGNELKGYGNLVLVRHSNGFVTAYAHASELAVKKGEAIKRGQVIGKAGATGNVTAPQLHFEVRKGATPVDPMQYLQGG